LDGGNKIKVEHNGAKDQRDIYLGDEEEADLVCQIDYVHQEIVQNQEILPWNVALGLAELFKVLGDPTRVRILDVLARTECCVCDLAELLGMSQSAVSHQLRLLRNTHLVRYRRDGKMVYYTLDDEHVTQLYRQGIEHVAELSAEKKR